MNKDYFEYMWNSEYQYYTKEDWEQCVYIPESWKELIKDKFEKKGQISMFTGILEGEKNGTKK